jgi:hypothetical protein
LRNIVYASVLTQSWNRKAVEKENEGELLAVRSAVPSLCSRGTQPWQDHLNWLNNQIQVILLIAL